MTLLAILRIFLTLKNEIDCVKNQMAQRRKKYSFYTRLLIIIVLHQFLEV